MSGPVPWRRLFDGPLANVEADEPNVVEIEREVIPVIFVPGIMGSRLKRNWIVPDDNGGSDPVVVWNPDDMRFLDILTRRHYYKTLRTWLIGAKFDRRYLTVVGRTRSGGVDEGDREAFDTYGGVLGFGGDPGAYDRGWAGVYQRTYFSFLQALDRAEWSEPVRHCFELPVHAFGYNWTDSNIATGRDLKAYIERTIADYDSRGRVCSRVLLVSHSMGGFVCRAAARELERAHSSRDSPVLGVVHVAQPATGSPETYQAMKAGVSGWLGFALGRWGKETTALMGNMPGALELLPSAAYRRNPTEADPEGSPHWISYTDVKTATLVQLPSGGDPYEEVYRERKKFYRPVDENWLDPSGRDAQPWTNYLARLASAQAFHQRHDGYHHPDSVQVHATGVETIDRVSFTHERRGMLDWMWPDFRRLRAETPLPISGYQRGVDDEGVVWDDDHDEREADPTAGVPRPTDPAPDWLVSMGWPGGRIGGTVVGEPPEFNGDGTVPDTSARHLDLGDPTRTARLAPAVESRVDYRTHSALMDSEPVRHAVRMAIENACLARIEGVVRPPPGPPERPAYLPPTQTVDPVENDPGTPALRRQLAYDFYYSQLQAKFARIGLNLSTEVEATDTTPRIPPTELPKGTLAEDVVVVPAHINKQLRGIDFDRPVETVSLRPGTLVHQWQRPGARQGDYYTPYDPSPAPPDEIGISDVAAPDTDGDPLVPKVVVLYRVTIDTHALRSFAGEILDDWGAKSSPRLTEGGRIQYFSTSTSHFVP